jgi:hypothetical protein
VAKVRYFHTPLRSVAHAVGDAAAWAARWESAFALGQGNPTVPEDTAIVQIEAFLEGYRGPTPIVEARSFHDFADRKPDLYGLIVEDVRNRCRLVGAVTERVAVHIRRGDVALPGSRFANRLTTIEAVARTVSLVRRLWPDLPIHIYSQGPAADFSGLPRGCVLHLDTDVFDTLSDLINARVLVTAQSSFSYVAALLSRGLVLYQPHRHRPLSSWVVLSPDGTFYLTDAMARRALG